MIDKDEKAYPTELLKQWKMDAEKKDYDRNMRIVAVANQSGGVGTSSVTAYLAQAVSIITEEKVLCISAAACDDVGTILLGMNAEVKRDGIMPTNYTGIDYMGDEAIRKLYRKEIEFSGVIRPTGNEVEKRYKYIFVDCGNGVSDEKLALFHMATDVIIPIGEHSHTDTGIRTVGRWLEKPPAKVRVWPLYSIGLTFSNNIYRRKWYQKVWKEINKIAANERISIQIPSVVIPKSQYVGVTLDIWNDRKTNYAAYYTCIFRKVFIRVLR